MSLKDLTPSHHIDDEVNDNSTSKHIDSSGANDTKETKDTKETVSFDTLLSVVSRVEGAIKESRERSDSFNALSGKVDKLSDFVERLIELNDKSSDTDGNEDDTPMSRHPERYIPEYSQQHQPPISNTDLRIMDLIGEMKSLKADFASIAKTPSQPYQLPQDNTSVLLSMMKMFSDLIETKVNVPKSDNNDKIMTMLLQFILAERARVPEKSESLTDTIDAIAKLRAIAEPKVINVNGEGEVVEKDIPLIQRLAHPDVLPSLLGLVQMLLKKDGGAPMDEQSLNRKIAEISSKTSAIATKQALENFIRSAQDEEDVDESDYNADDLEQNELENEDHVPSDDTPNDTPDNTSNDTKTEPDINKAPTDNADVNLSADKNEQVDDTKTLNSGVLIDSNKHIDVDSTKGKD